jgi:hypothetical protein
MRIATRSLVTLLAAPALVVSGISYAQSASGPTGPGDRAAAGDRAGGHVGRVASLKRTSEGGYYYGSWGQDNRITVTLVEGGLRFRDPRPVRWEDMARGCHRQQVQRGVAAICRVPGDVNPGHPMTIELELRLGDDYVDTTTLGAEFQMKVLADQGSEEIHLGAGDDWVNGFLHRDRVWGGDGDDFIRGGEGPDVLYGEGGRDELVGLEGDDTLYGGDGNDAIKCGDGNDAAEPDDSDSIVVGCEHTTE